MPSFYPAPPPLPVDIGSAEHPIKIILVPSSDASKIESATNALTTWLAQKTGLTYTTSIAKTQMEAVDALGNGNAQIAWLDAFSYVAAKKRYNVAPGVAIVRQGKDSTTSEIIVNKAAGIATLGDLKGKTWCVADRQSLADSIVPNIILTANGIDARKDVRVIETGSSAQTVRAVYYRDCDAGAVPQGIREDVRKELSDVLERTQVLDTSPGIPNPAVVFTGQFPTDKRDTVVRALVDMPTTEQGKRLLAAHPDWIDGFAPPSDSAYDRLRDLFTKAGVDVTQFMSK